MSATFRRLSTSVLILVAALMASTFLVSPSANAMSVQARSRVVHVAASKAGTPYVYGASGPSAFDCSGFTRWVYAKVGRHLPRTSSAQAGAVRHVSASDRRPGDLVFFSSGGHVYHVAIYAGGDSVWHAPRPGESVHREHLWTHAVSYGRVG